MRTTLSILLATSILIGCGGNTETATPGEANVGSEPMNAQAAAPVGKAAVPKSEDTYFQLSIAEGPLQGDYKFMRVHDTRGWVNVSLDDGGFSNLNATSLISDDGNMKLEYLNRHIQGELKDGELPAHTDEGRCGSINLKPRENFDSHQKVRAEHLSCTATEITVLSDWEETSAYRQRGVAGSYNDRLELEMIDGSMVESDVRVEFLAIERRPIN